MPGTIAATTTSSISNILKRVYASKESTALNNEDHLLTLLGGNVETEIGEGYYITVHLGRNGSGVNMVENDSFPDPDVQKRARLLVTTKEWGSSGGITFKALNTAANSGKAAIMRAITAEVDPTLDDAKQAKCQLMAFGGPSRGLIWLRAAAGAGSWQNAANAANTAAGAVAGAGVTATIAYDGDFTPFLNVVQATSSTWIRVDLTRNDRDVARAYKAFAAGQEVTLGGDAATFATFVTAIDQGARTISITLVCDGAAGTASISTAGVTAGFGISVQLSVTVYTIAAVAVGTIARNAKNQPLATVEQTGLLSNLTKGTHWGLDISGATTTSNFNPKLQSWVWSMTTLTTGARAAWSAERVNLLMASIHNAGGGSPDLLLMNMLTNHTIIAAIQQTSRYNFDEGSAKDIGPRKTMILGYTPEFSQHIPVGLCYFLKKKCWTMFELAPLHFVEDGEADGQDGRLLLNRGSNSFLFNLYTDWDFMCREPHYQGVICGLTV